MLAAEGGVEPVLILNKADLVKGASQQERSKAGALEREGTPPPTNHCHPERNDESSRSEVDRVSPLALAVAQGSLHQSESINEISSESKEKINNIKTEVEKVAPNVPIVFLSAKDNSGFRELRKHLKAGETVSFVGSTGVGKSTIINSLLGEEKMKTQEVREGSIGRHTTTHKELFLLPSGAMVIDTPGVRELGMWKSSEKKDEKKKNSFDDIEELALGCKFNDCTHETEPGCVVKEALDNGELDYNRFESFHKLEKEMDYIEQKKDKLKSANSKKKWKGISKEIKRMEGRGDF